MTFWKSLFVFVILLVVAVGVAYLYVSNYHQPLSVDDVAYGATFSKLRAEELNLPWQETYDALLDELGVRKLRLVAHWDMVEPAEGVFTFDELDYQMRRAEEVGAEVILAIGRRLPSWPECHEPEWAADDTRVRQEQQLAYMRAVVERYQDSPALKWWQVENEPFIIGYAREQCGELDVPFLDEEIALVRQLDPAHPMLLTASGELGLFNNTWNRADVFGTTLYRSVWNLDLNSYITYPLPPSLYRAKLAFVELLSGERKPAIIAELALESWTPQATRDTPLSEQLSRMNLQIFDETIQYAAETGFPEQYVWGAEWWYYLKKTHDYPELWERGKELFK